MDSATASTELPSDKDLARTRFYDRYRTLIDIPIDWNDTLDTILSHRSVRAYLPDPLPAGTLELITAAAQSAATSSNLQRWSVIAVEDPDRKQRLAGYAGNQKHIVDARTPCLAG